MEALRFRCLPGCTNCCRQRGYVYLTPEDLTRAARSVGMTGAEFEARYVYRTAHLLRLRKPRRSECPFLLETGCRLHPDKPTQCRVFPFWPELVEQRKAWEEAGRFCPGIGQGPLIRIGTALEASRAMRAAYPAMYAERRPRQKRVTADNLAVNRPSSTS